MLNNSATDSEIKCILQISKDIQPDLDNYCMIITEVNQTGRQDLILERSTLLLLHFLHSAILFLLLDGVQGLAKQSGKIRGIIAISIYLIWDLTINA